MNAWERQEFINDMKQVDNETLSVTRKNIELDDEIHEIDKRIALEMVKAEMILRGMI